MADREPQYDQILDLLRDVKSHVSSIDSRTQKQGEDLAALGARDAATQTRIAALEARMSAGETAGASLRTEMSMRGKSLDGMAGHMLSGAIGLIGAFLLQSLLSALKIK